MNYLRSRLNKLNRRAWALWLWWPSLKWNSQMDRQSAVSYLHHSTNLVLRQITNNKSEDVTHQHRQRSALDRDELLHSTCCGASGSARAPNDVDTISAMLIHFTTYTFPSPFSCFPWKKTRIQNIFNIMWKKVQKCNGPVIYEFLWLPTSKDCLGEECSTDIFRERYHRHLSSNPIGATSISVLI